LRDGEAEGREEKGQEGKGVQCREKGRGANAPCPTQIPGTFPSVIYTTPPLSNHAYIRLCVLSVRSIISTNFQE